MKNWIKVVRIKDDVLTPFSYAEGYKNYFKKLLGVDFTFNCYKYIDGDMYYLEEELSKQNESLKNKPRLISKILRINKKYTSNYYKWAKTNYRNEGTLKDFEEFMENYTKANSILMAALGSENILKLMIEQRLEKKIDPIKEYDRFKSLLNSIYVSTTDTETIKEKKELIRIASEIEKKGFNDLMENPKQDKEIYEMIKKHCKKYAWMGMHMLNYEPYSEEKVIERINNILEDSPSNVLNSLEENQAKIKEEFEDALNQIKPDNELISLINLVQNLIFFRTWRIETLHKANYYAMLLLEKIAKKHDLTYVQFVHMTPSEVLETIGGEKPDLEKIAKRQKGFVFIYDLEMNVYEDVEKFKTEEKAEHKETISGMSASKGNAKGSVKVIHDKDEIYKVEKGDILVTEMTTPDFVMAMEKAKAIVTDLGGITCHAAIVSRELGIPCIVGTNNATKILKNGDIVEVDADKGIVKIIKIK